MTERAQALEAAREWQIAAYGDSPETWAALAFYRERDWPVDVNTFPERARVEDRLFSFMAGYREARRLAVQPPPPVGSPTTDTRQDCTCLGTCRGAEGLGPRWKCALEKSTPVAPAGASESPSEMDSGIVLLVSAASAASGYLERQQPDLAAWLWNAVQLVLNSQSAPVSPVEPAGASEPPSDYIDIVFDGPPASESGRFIEVENAQGASIRVGEWVHRPDGYWALRLPAPVSPVEPTPNDTLLRNIRMAAAMGLSFGHQATPQPMERMVERKDKRLRQILTLLAEHGVTGSMLRAESNAPVEPTPEPPVHNDLCSWCLTQADHVAASEECYERNSQRGRSAPVSTGEPAPAVEREGMTAPKNECGKCRMLGSIGPCDEHGPLGVSPSPVLEPTPEPPKCVCSACEPLVDPGQRPSLEDINRLEKAAWDSKTDRVLVWYRDQIGLYQQRIRETERAWQLERKQKPTGAPAPCVWREEWVEYGNNHGRDEVKTGCGLSEDADEMRPLMKWPFCPQCGSPLKVDR